MNRATRRPRHLLIVGLILSLAGCTTVTRTTLVASDGAQSGAGGTVADNTLGPTSDGQPGSSASHSAGSRSTSQSSAPGIGSTGAAAASGPANSGSRSASLCKQTVKLGVSYSSDLGQAVGATGNTSAATQTNSYVQAQHDIWQRAADYINAHGSLGGCKVQIAYHDFHTTGDWTNESQLECTDFAQDQKVFAVIPNALENKTLIDCLASKKVVTLYNGAGGFTPQYPPVARDFAKYRGYLYQPWQINSDRFAPFIQLWDRGGYFDHGSSTKVGILIASDGSGNNERLVSQIWQPKLVAMGIHPVTYSFNVHQSLSEAGNVTQQMQAAVLAFRHKGVDHVIFTPSPDSSYFFPTAASSQKYYPRYALTSASGIPGWATTTVPDDEKAGAVGVSWLVADLGYDGTTADSSQLSSNPSNSARSQCKALFQGHTSGQPIELAYPVCDDIYFLLKALANANGSVTPANLLAGTDGLGQSLSLASTYTNASFAKPDKYDGGASARLCAWDSKSGKWKYTSPVTGVS